MAENVNDHRMFRGRLTNDDKFQLILIKDYNNNNNNNNAGIHGYGEMSLRIYS